MFLKLVFDEVYAVCHVRQELGYLTAVHIFQFHLHMIFESLCDSVQKPFFWLIVILDTYFGYIISPFIMYILFIVISLYDICITKLEALCGKVTMCWGLCLIKMTNFIYSQRIWIHHQFRYWFKILTISTVLCLSVHNPLLMKFPLLNSVPSQPDYKLTVLFSNIHCNNIFIFLLCLPSGYFPSSSLTKKQYAFLVSPVFSHSIILLDVTNITILEPLGIVPSPTAKLSPLGPSIGNDFLCL